jgi:hypothetical protein
VFYCDRFPDVRGIPQSRFILRNSTVFVNYRAGLFFKRQHFACQLVMSGKKS